MNKKIALIFTFFYCISFYSQKIYPKNYFQNPLDIPIVLAGTFGELRKNHFHSGIDIKTQKREGLPVLAAANGYVSRIKIQHWGFGKALYVKHPNGYTTVYAHLKKFSPEIEAFIKKKQYAKESYEIQLFPQENQLSVKKGKPIAFSGNTGGSSAPHLHYEIRDSKTEKIINPLLFGIEVSDHKNPIIGSSFIYPLDDFSAINQSNKKQKLEIKRQENGDLKATKVYASGVIGIGVKSFDRLDDAMNKNGIYHLEMFVNGNKIYEHKLETFSFSESKYINLLVDHPHYFNKRQRIQKCFIVDNNKLSIYNNVVNNGNISVQDGMKYTVEVVASDLKGNKTKLIIPIEGKNQEILERKEVQETDYYFKRTDFNKITKSDVSITIPKYSFYEDLYFDFSYENGIVSVHNGSVPIHKSYTLNFDVSDYTASEQKQLFIAKVNKYGKLSYSNTKRKENKLYSKTRSFGDFKLASDTKKPTIKPKNFKDGQWLTSYRYLQLKISDDLSAIKKYRATIDDKWVLMEYEPKTGILTYDFNDVKYTTAKHTLKVVVSDHVNNTKTYIATFYKKK
jgi:hypothetical protein